MANDATAEPSFEVHREFSFDDGAFNEIRASLDGVKTTLCDHLSKEPQSWLDIGRGSFVHLSSIPRVLDAHQLTRGKCSRD
jgi:hypothetical protein